MQFADTQILGYQSSTGVQGEKHDPSKGLYCSTTSAPRQDRQGLVEHLQSDLHKYNLKRKIAGLPPVTREWFQARKAQLASAQAQGAQSAVPQGCVRIWACPLTKKVFKTEHTFQAHTRSRKFQDLLKKAGMEQPPAPIISDKPVADMQPQQGRGLTRGKACQEVLAGCRHKGQAAAGRVAC
jgi:pre-60S factor REI1